MTKTKPTTTTTPPRTGWPKRRNRRYVIDEGGRGGGGGEDVDCRHRWSPATKTLVAIATTFLLLLLAPPPVALGFAVVPPSPSRRSLGSTHAAERPPSSRVPSLSSPTTPPPRRSHATSSTSLSGIPKMFRWLTDRYPQINRRLSEGLPDDAIVDNFYLDMNGIIHPCTHGNVDDEIVVLDEREMFRKIFGYVDRLYKLVRPRRLLYLAVDGVAPRAKMNQQRARRFRSSKEAEELASTILARDGTLPQGTKFDSNCITPGTDFMLKLSLALHKWVEYKIETDKVWRDGADVVVSGPDVPGEGEHKVMDYIRETKALYRETPSDDAPSSSESIPHWKPNLTHVLYGLDADLIMLGLVTHEPNFVLLREKMSVVMAGRGRHKHRKKKDVLEYDRDDFELLELSILRQLFEIQFRKFARDPNVLNVPYDPRRIVDDFVFLCALVGNDFLPHVPHLEIDNGALGLMLNEYTELLEKWGDYLTDKERIHPLRFEELVHRLAFYEQEHFKRRGYEENEPGWQLSSEDDDGNDDDDYYGVFYGGMPTPKAAKPANRVPEEDERRRRFEATNDGIANGQDAAAAATMSSRDPNVAARVGKKFRRRHPGDECKSYRDYYYETKMGWSPAREERGATLKNRRAQVRDYLEGLHWVLNYYHNGCPSWDWYYPHLYAPLATDMVNLDEFYDDTDDDDGNDNGFKSFPFDPTEPFPNLAQLLSVLPPQSASLLPPPLAELMIHPSSPLAKFYPRDFESDPNGRRQPWEAVVKIPFIEADALREEVNRILEADARGTTEPLLSNAERRRNVRGERRTYVAKRDIGGGGRGKAGAESAVGVRKKSATNGSRRKAAEGGSGGGGGRRKAARRTSKVTREGTKK